MYEIEYREQALLDIYKLKKSEPAAYRKVESLIGELKEHPKTGTGHPEPLKGNLSGFWSREIDEKNRLVYKIENDCIKIYQCKNHYDDK
jgi:toxin YoeB